MAQLNVNLSDVNEKDAEGGGGVVVPRDRYLLNIVEGEVKRNSKNTGDLFEYKAEIIEGEFAGVKVFGNINVTHQNVTAQKIGQAQLAALAEATGIGKNNLTDTDQVLFQPFYADLDIETYQKNGQDKERSVVKRFIHAGNANEPPPGKDAPAANDNTKTATATKPQSNPSTARSTGNGGAAASGGARQMPWQRTA